MMSWLRGFTTTLVAALAVVVAQPVTTSASDPVPPFIQPTADWLSTVNYYRAMAGEAPVTENSTLSVGAGHHSCYMLYNGISHDEVPGNPGYTVDGDAAGNAGNVAVSSAYGTTARSHIELWMTGPFHAIGVLRYNLRTVGFGKCDLTTTPTWHSGATLNVLSGLVTATRPSTPILFPGNGTTTNLSQFITESPNPLTFCGISSAGLPVIAMMPEAVSSVSATITGPNGAVPTCTLYGGNTSGDAKAILAGDNAVTVLPKSQLTPGTYTVTVTTQARTVRWSFTVDPTAATGVMPIPTVIAAGTASSFTTVTPFRFADSRSANRITPLLANTPKRIKVAGTAGLPADATAISANFTITHPTGSSFLTVYNCSSVVPTASTVNFSAGENVAAAGVFPLASTGDLCVISPVATDLIIDVTGYFSASSTQRFEGLTPTRWVDSTSGLVAAGRVGAGQSMTANIYAGNLGIPNGATAVALNITGLHPSTTGFITAYGCGIAVPSVSNVNIVAGGVQQNFAVVPVSSAGDVCLWASTDMDIKVDVLGYFSGGGTGTITPTAPTRVVDTRDLYRTQMNLGTAGNYLTANTTITLSLAGQRGVPSSSRAVSLTVTAVHPSGNGSITVWGCGTEPPVQSINYVTGKTVANGMEVKLSSSGAICVRSTTATHLVIDVTGWWG